MAYGFRSVFLVNLYVLWFVSDCVMVKDQFHGVLGVSETEHCVSGQQNLKQNGKRGVPKFSHTLVNRPCQLWTTITFSSELRFARSWTLRKTRRV